MGKSSANARGGIEFMRVFADKVYGIPPEQVIGSSIVTKFEMVSGVPVLTRLPEMNFMDDNVGKPVGTQCPKAKPPMNTAIPARMELKRLKAPTAPTQTK